MVMTRLCRIKRRWNLLRGQRIHSLIFVRDFKFVNFPLLKYLDPALDPAVRPTSRIHIAAYSKEISKETETSLRGSAYPFFDLCERLQIYQFRFADIVQILLFIFPMCLHTRRKLQNYLCDSLIILCLIFVSAALSLPYTAS